MAIASPDLRVDTIVETLGDEADYLLNHRCETIPRDDLALPGPDFAERVWLDSDRNPQVIRSLQQIYDSGRLSGSRLCLDSCRLIKALSIRLAPPSRPTRLTFDPVNIIRVGAGRRLQRGRVNLRRAGLDRPPLRSSHPLHRQGQPQ